MATTTTKEQARREILARRAARTPDARERAATDLAAWVRSAPWRLERDVTVAAYLPMSTEPGSTAMIDALIEHGVTVLVPTVSPGDPGPLDWVGYDADCSIERGAHGFAEPTGPRLGADAIRSASVVLMPALAVDRTGIRLGRGAGYYDRSLAGLTADLVAVVYDDEVTDALPAESHDVPVGWVLTPGGGFVSLW